jgi:hypothetical protein
VDGVDAAARQACCIADGGREGRGEAVEDAPNESLACGRGRLAGSLQRGLNPRRHVTGRQERRIVRVDGRTAGLEVRRADQEAFELPGFAASAHVRIDSCRSHSPITLRRKRTRPSTPRSLVKFAARLASVTTGPSSSTPTRPHVPHEI